MTSAGPPWHQNLLGNATEPLLYIFGMILTFVLLSGKWWIMLYLLFGIILFFVVLLYALYLEYNAQEYLEAQRNLMKRRPRLGRVQ